MNTRKRSFLHGFVISARLLGSSGIRGLRGFGAIYGLTMAEIMVDLR
jgi:hypothetical protein